MSNISESLPTLTIGALAHAGGVGVETVRYYQQRELLPVPEATHGFRRYPTALAQRIRFIKRAQSLGFALDEIGDLLRLEDGGNRRAIRAIAAHRVAQTDKKLTDLRRMKRLLSGVIEDCEHAGSAKPCPIIASLNNARIEGEHEMLHDL